VEEGNLLFIFPHVLQNDIIKKAVKQWCMVTTPPLLSASGDSEILENSPLNSIFIIFWNYFRKKRAR
jgi:hypothetical protein